MRFRNSHRHSLVEDLGYSDGDILVIVNLDDVGMHRDETEAGFELLNSGVVKTGSLMAPAPYFHQAVEMWKEHPESDLGVHLTLTCEWGEKYPWGPVLARTEVPSLYNSKNWMWQDIPDFLQHADLRHIRMELEAQIKAVIDCGINPTHMDYHMDFHQHADLLSIIIELSRDYSIPLRAPKRKRYRLPFVKHNLPSLRRKGFVFCDTQIGFYYMNGPDQTCEFRKQKYFDHLKSLKPGVHSIKIHAAFQTKEIEELMGPHFASVRQIDYDIWSSNEISQLASDLAITFIGYRPLQELQKSKMNRH